MIAITSFRRISNFEILGCNKEVGYERFMAIGSLCSFLTISSEKRICNLRILAGLLVVRRYTHTYIQRHYKILFCFVLFKSQKLNTFSRLLKQRLERLLFSHISTYISLTCFWNITTALNFGLCYIYLLIYIHTFQTVSHGT